MKKISRRSKLQSIVMCKEAVDKGFETAKEISEYTGLAQGTIYQYSRENKIDIKLLSAGFPKFTSGNVAKNREIVDGMIFEGRTQEEIGKEIGSHRESIRQYINNSGQYNLWKEKNRELLLKPRLKKEAERQTKKNLISILKSYAIQKAKKEGHGEAMEYYLTSGFIRERDKISYLLKLMNLLDFYKNTKEREEKLSYKKLAELSGFGEGEAGAVRTHKTLKKMGLKSLCWDAPKTPKWKIDAIERAEQSIVYFGRRELAYFLDMNKATVVINSKIKRTSRRGGKIKFFSKGFATGSINVLTYRVASQIYGFKDEFNASDEEISSAIGKNLRVVSYALEHRVDIEPKLIQGLKILFPDKTIEKPYL